MQVDGRFCDELMADRVRFEQVLLNLFVNGMEAMPDGGLLSVRIAQIGDFVKIEVADTGGGIAPELHDRVFDAYFTTKGSGTGLGLALCDKIMRQHNGVLDFLSSSSGTTFRMTLPIKYEANRSE